MMSAANSAHHETAARFILPLLLMTFVIPAAATAQERATTDNRAKAATKATASQAVAQKPTAKKTVTAKPAAARATARAAARSAVVEKAVKGNRQPAAVEVTAGPVVAEGAEADGEDTEAAEEKKDPLQVIHEKMVTAAVDEFRTVAQSHLHLQIEEMEAIAGLDEKSARKLKIAAKGAAEAHVKKHMRWIKDALTTRPPNVKTIVKVGERQINPPPDPNAKPAAPKKKTSNPLLKFIRNINAGNNPIVNPEDNFITVTVSMQSTGMQVQTRQKNSSSSHGFGGGLQELQTQEIWKKALDNSVTAEQKKKYDAVVAERRERLRKTAIAFRVGRLDADLQFTDEQRIQLTNLMLKKVDLKNYGANMVEYRVREGLRSLKNEELAGFLDESQLKLLKTLKEQY